MNIYENLISKNINTFYTSGKDWRNTTIDIIRGAATCQV